ncbi:putative bifunctional diguanylate cyclase/phosphodiesterase [Muricoccus aerilatus]|uniref:putative bifunctional diguanylate cyclase/phosphodiesterase n=1 Tax=Muricoccus aerilatus TaxID=452982 RepID=UPI000693C65F|nr:bifunctional diguanylate cyclase/phosphodiesterase [Roseomonas aerilata]
MTRSDEATLRGYRRLALVGVTLVLAAAVAALAAVLLLPADSVLPALAALPPALAAFLLGAGFMAWPALRQAVLLREAIERAPIRYTLLRPDGTLLDRSAAHDLPDAGAPAGVEGPDRDYDLVLPDGRTLRVSERRLAGGEVARLAVDVTAVRAAERRARAIHENVPAAIWRLDAEGRTLSANGRLLDLFGGTAPGSLAEVGLHPCGPAGGGPFGLPVGQEAEAVLPPGGTLPERRVIVVASSWLEDEGGAREAVLMLQDITRRHLAEARAAHLALHDPLTGLPNRARFRQALAELGGDDSGGALILAELCELRTVNESLGLLAGDAMLREAGERLCSVIRPSDIAFRLGGSEFAVIARCLRDGVAAHAIAERIGSAFARPLDLGSGAAPLRTSIGLARMPEDAADAGSLHRAAALALAGARRAGGPAICTYDAALGESFARRRALREGLRAAATKGAFQLAWQPQVDGRTGALRGAEALIRWPNGPGGPVSPGEFLPVAEAMGLMPAIDAWVLEETLRQKAAWMAAGSGPEVVGVNISPLTLRDPGFPARVSSSLARYGVDARWLEVEIPEVVAASDIDSIAPVLHQLIAYGVRLSLDDFGGGSSALAHLLRLPVDQVKLDRSIVAGLPSGERERAILRAVAALAQGMEIPLLAEGVETEAQRDALLSEGCFIMQGWLFGRAVLAEELPAYPAAS